MRRPNKQVSIKQLGRKAYQEAWAIQETLFDEIVAIKLENRKSDASHQKLTPNYLLFCEHPHVYTLGRSGTTAHLLASEATLQAQGVAFYTTTQAPTTEQRLIGLRAVALICQYTAPCRELHLIQTIPQKLPIMYVG